ncbi:hypothetical protein TWF481_007200 [Arthrobotrys musiformis]|uniref:Uncharacterized protein n=1 Tax=Arthrobotrys musiformis TaxID=47236 RepID=A0AAV9WCE1_9PEZI
MASLYRACLRELPPLLPRMARLPETRKPVATPALCTRRLSLHKHLRLAIQAHDPGQPTQLQPDTSKILRVQQMVRYLGAQRSYIELLERYNAGLLEGNQDRIRRAARRVGLDIAE